LVLSSGAGGPPLSRRRGEKKLKRGGREKKGNLAGGEGEGGKKGLHRETTEGVNFGGLAGERKKKRREAACPSDLPVGGGEIPGGPRSSLIYWHLNDEHSFPVKVSRTKKEKKKKKRRGEKKGEGEEASVVLDTLTF